MLVLGRNTHYREVGHEHANVEQVYLSDAARRQGTYIIGTTGTGKTTLLLNMIFQDMKRGDGLCVLDPHGDFTYDILARVPRERWDDVILFDPADIEYPCGLNLFDCNKDDPRERDLVVSTVIDTLHKLFADSWGPRMEDLLRHSILSLLHHPEPTTLIHLMMVMVNYEKRQELTKTAKKVDPILRFYWEDQFPERHPKGTEKPSRPRDQIELVSSSLNKIGRFIANPVIRHIVGQPKTSFNLREIMDEGKILIVNLSKGDLGQDNASLLGAVIVNQFLIAALSRREIPEGSRRPFHLYVDEFQNFATKAFPQLQSEARKYGIDTVVAHQFRDQLDEENQGSSLNVANIISLRISGKDAVEIAGQFDLTPEIEIKFEPMYIPVDEDGEIFAKDDTMSGVGLHRQVARDKQTFSDVRLETANLLAQLPNHQSICRLLSANNHPRRLHQFRIDLADKPAVLSTTGEQAVAYIRQRSREKHSVTRKEIETFIATYTRTDTGDGAIGIFDTK